MSNILQNQFMIFYHPTLNGAFQNCKKCQDIYYGHHHISFPWAWAQKRSMKICLQHAGESQALLKFESSTWVPAFQRYSVMTLTLISTKDSVFTTQVFISTKWTEKVSGFFSWGAASCQSTFHPTGRSHPQLCKEQIQWEPSKLSWINMQTWDTERNSCSEGDRKEAKQSTDVCCQSFTPLLLTCVTQCCLENCHSTNTATTTQGGWLLPFVQWQKWWR